MPTDLLTHDSTFLDLVDSINAAEASPERIYAGEGRRVGRPSRQTAATERYRRGLLEAARLYGRVLRGDRRAALTFQEAMSTSDFSYLFADIIDRQILAAYRSAPVMWQSIARRGTVRDFRAVNRYTLDGGEAVLDEVKQLSEYKAASLTDGRYQYSVKKYGRTLPISWETLINDDLDALRDLPQRLGNAARRSEERFVTDLFAGTSGPDSTFFAGGNNNVVTSNPALSITALQTALTVLAAQTDTDGAPIYVEAAWLVVPPALEVTALNILNATQIEMTDAGGTSNQRLIAANWMRNRVKPLVNPWLPIISTSNGNTSWYLIADPGVGRPAMEVGFLTGHELPELWVKSPNATRVGGGPVAPEEGDFETDSIVYRVRHVFGGTLMDPKSAVASNGTGS
jgi:hypothetical protein